MNTSSAKLPSFFFLLAKTVKVVQVDKSVDEKYILQTGTVKGFSVRVDEKTGEWHNIDFVVEFLNGAVKTIPLECVEIKEVWEAKSEDDIISDFKHS